ncbi:MAG: GldG family protein [Chloroflexota bacterium]|nr:GldG family protein [Chloroflexota bacterium]
MRARLQSIAAYLAYAGLLALVVGFGMYLVTRQFDTTVEVLLIVGTILVVLFVVLRPDQVRRALTGRTARYGGSATLMSVALIGILVLVNFLGNRHYERFDLTASKAFSLSPQTIQILAELEEPIEITGFFTVNYYGRQQADDLIKEYQYDTNKLLYQVIDPELQPGVARQYGITRDGTILFQQGERRQEVYYPDEKGITSAILRVTEDETKTVYFITGHKEHDPEGSAQGSYSTVRQALLDENYQVGTLNLATITDTVPVDAAALILAAPQVPFTDEETDVLRAYLDGGGKLMFLTDPTLPNVLGNDYLAQWGFSLRNDMVIDPVNAFFGDYLSPLVTSYPYSTITKDLGGLSSFFPIARSIEAMAELPDGVATNRLVETGPDSWGETDLESRQVGNDEEVDAQGPLVLGISAEMVYSGGRLVVFGDSDFAADDLLSVVSGALANKDLFLNAVNWLTEEEILISIRSKPPDVRQIAPLTGIQQRLILYSSVVLLPLVVIFAGLWVWLSRK